MSHARIDRYVEAFEQLRPDSLDRLLALFGEQARFVDPFNDARGQGAIRAVFEHMFRQCESPRFLVTERVGEGEVCYLRWTFTFGSGGRRRSIDGVSRIRFGADDLVEEHIDYWDPAAQLYESIPLLGGVLRALRRRLSAGRDHPHPPQAKHRDASLATERFEQ
jgi:ketosteroid isomerase-like protein